MSEKKIKLSFKKLQEIDGLVALLYSKNDKLQQSKFGYAYKRFVNKNYVPALNEFRDKLADLRVDFALTDEKTKEVLVDSTNPRGFKYDKEGLKKIMEAERKISKEQEEKEVECELYISAYVPEGLDEEQKELLQGILIDETSVEMPKVEVVNKKEKNK